MTKPDQHLIARIFREPAKLWIYAIIPFFGLVTMICLLSGNCSIFTADQIGYRLFTQEQYEEAAEGFVDSQWTAAALYRSGEFKQAAALFSGYDTAAGAFNHGNSLVMLGNYEEAIQRYQRALVLKPGWEAAENNLEIARLRAERVKKEGGEMTGGQLEADDYTFSDNKSSPSDTETVVEQEKDFSDKEIRAIWLRSVQTEPADFLRSKFAYQQSMTSAAPEPPETETN